MPPAVTVAAINPTVIVPRSRTTAPRPRQAHRLPEVPDMPQPRPIRAGRTNRRPSPDMKNRQIGHVGRMGSFPPVTILIRTPGQSLFRRRTTARKAQNGPGGRSLSRSSADTSRRPHERIPRETRGDCPVPGQSGGLPAIPAMPPRMPRSTPPIARTGGLAAPRTGWPGRPGQVHTRSLSV